MGVVTALTVALLASFAPPAFAQPPPAEAAPRSGVVPPRPLEPLRADYPDGAQGDSEVLLEMTINADGAVRSARVVEGQEPFTTAALRASSTFHFAPATRDGKASRRFRRHN